MILNHRGWRLHARVLVVLGLCCVGVTVAQTEVSDCAPLTDPYERLQCFDQLAESVNTAELGRWVVRRASGSAASDVTLELEADNEIQRMPFSYRPRLEIRCRSAELDVIVEVGMEDLAANPSTKRSVDLQLRGEALPQAVTARENGAALHFDDPASVVRLLLKNEQVTLSFVPRHDSPKTIFFDLRGLVSRIKIVEQACPIDLSQSAPVWRPSDGPLTPGVDGVTRPRLVSSVPPKYPILARRFRMTGEVELQAIVKRDGSVEVLNVMKAPEPDAGFSVAARQAVSQWRYEPARRLDQPVDVRLAIVVNFAAP